MYWATIPKKTWQLNDRIGKDRKEYLLGTSYSTIVSEIQESFELVKYRPEPMKSNPKVKRAAICIKLSSKTVDLFHSGAGGYRAQFYSGIELGKKANRYLIDQLLDHLEQRKVKAFRKWSRDFLEISLKDESAKVWIHQGSWFRHKKIDLRNLSTKRWEKNWQTTELPKPLFPIWAQLTPQDETCLELKGGWLTKGLDSYGTLKKDRAKQIMSLGYT